MVDLFSLQPVALLNWALVFALFIYVLFAAIVVWQIQRLISNVKTNLSTLLSLLGLLNLLLSFLCLVAGVSLL